MPKEPPAPKYPGHSSLLGPKLRIEVDLETLHDDVRDIYTSLAAVSGARAHARNLIDIAARITTIRQQVANTLRSR